MGRYRIKGNLLIRGIDTAVRISSPLNFGRNDYVNEDFKGKLSSGISIFFFLIKPVPPSFSVRLSQEYNFILVSFEDYIFLDLKVSIYNANLEMKLFPVGFK